MAQTSGTTSPRCPSTVGLFKTCNSSVTTNDFFLSLCSDSKVSLSGEALFPVDHTTRPAGTIQGDRFQLLLDFQVRY